MKKDILVAILFVVAALMMIVGLQQSLMEEVITGAVAVVGACITAGTAVALDRQP